MDLELDSNQKLLKVEKVDFENSGINCADPILIKKFDKVADPLIPISGVVRYSSEPKLLIHFGNQITFVEISNFVKNIMTQSQRATDNEEFIDKLLQEPSQTAGTDTQPQASKLNDFLSFNPFVVSYNEDFLKVKNHLQLDQVQIFNVVKHPSEAKSDESEVFLFLFGKSGIVVNTHNSINQFLEFNFEEDPLNEIVICTFH